LDAKLSANIFVAYHLVTKKQFTMKRILIIGIALSAFFATTNKVNAQAWDRETKLLGFGVGASNYYHIDNYYNRGIGPRLGRGWYSPLTGQFNFFGEFAVHKYVGIGFTTGLGGRSGWGGYYAGSLNIPIGLLANFHFYQLIADKTGKDIHSDVLDIYAGITVGSGVAFIFDENTSRAIPIAFGGPHVGIRYYFVPTVGVTGEFGLGKSLINVGMVFKL
jgi:hypothetical protein